MATIKLIPLSKAMAESFASIMMGNLAKPNESRGPLKCVVGGKVCEIIEFNNLGLYLQSTGSKDCDVSVAYQYMNEIHILIVTESEDLLTWQMKFGEDTFLVDFEQYDSVLPLLGREVVIESKGKPWSDLSDIAKIKIPEVVITNGAFAWILAFDNITIDMQGRHNVEIVAGKLNNLGYKIIQ